MSGGLTVAGLGEDHVLEVLTRGTLEIRGRIAEASNATLLARASMDGTTLACVYKPVRGERPLWDFAEGTLARREVAAYELSRWCGLEVVPPTVLRDGPLGEGSVQAWVASAGADDEGDPVPEEGGAGLVDLFTAGSEPQGWLSVLSGEDGAGRPVVLAHADDARLAAMSLFDTLANNADRKVGHVLREPGGRVLGVDHGLTFHAEHKLRTVLWGFADRPLGADLLGVTERVAHELVRGSDVFGRLTRLLSPQEVTATRRRANRLVQLGVHPAPRPGYPAVPWPLF